MRLLMLSPDQNQKWNWGHQLFRNEFLYQAPTIYYGEGFTDNGKTNVQEIINELGPFDAVISYSNRYCGHYESMKNIEIPVIIIVPDYFPHALKVENAFISKHHPDIVIVRSIRSTELFYESQEKGRIPQGIHVRCLYYGINPNVFKVRYSHRDIDICCSMSECSWAYKNRPQIKEACHSLSQYNVYSNKIYRLDYANILSRSKMFVNSVSKDKVISPRYPEVMASCCMLMTDRTIDDSAFGLIHGKNCIFYDNIEDMKEKADYFLRHHGKRAVIAVEGMRLIRKKYTNEIQVKKVINMIKKHVDNKP